MKPTATGRLTRHEPEIQNIPGTPAHALEMYFARHGAPLAKRAADAWYKDQPTAANGELAKLLKGSK